jgi:hypothetical protein
MVSHVTSMIVVCSPCVKLPQDPSRFLLQLEVLHDTQFRVMKTVLLNLFVLVVH